ncbi:MAG: DUF4293 domain-containing protein [Paludibacteraceae bacterium]|nr:DUF4293 domain-containing protein [Paludibacteraceae bacterium]
MIQRRQTLYLLMVVILGTILYFCDVIQFTTLENSQEQRMFLLSAQGLEEVTPELDYSASQPVVLNGLWGLTVITLLIPLLALVDIFLYKRRLLQARLNILTAVVCGGYYAMVYMYIWFMRHQIQVDWNVCFGACLPLVCLVFIIGATRLILKDEMMVRAADRIR